MPEDSPLHITSDHHRKERNFPEWRTLCLVFKEIDVGLPGGRFWYLMHPEETEKALASFRQFPRLAKECSRGMANISFHVEYAGRPLTGLTATGGPAYWPSPRDVCPELLRHARAYDSVFVLWPQNDLDRHAQIPSPGWGLAIGPGHIPGGGTYCSIANAPGYCWDTPLVGEVWLHEWLHGICDFFERKGFPMPERNADGGSCHGYTRSPVAGWGRYYHDLMTGRVAEGGRMTGITPEAWSSGTIRSPKKKTSIFGRIFKI